MNILIVGSGSREHALTWKISKSPSVSEVYVWPGNAVTIRKWKPFACSDKASFTELYSEVLEKKIELIICGPEQPLADGLADYFEEKNIPVFGPKKEVAKLESSKSFAKEIMREAGIPTASYFIAKTKEECEKTALKMLKEEGGAVLKASGLAGGKGVFVCFEESEIRNGIEHLYNTGMKMASEEVVVESVLKGRECSFFTFIGKEDYSTLGFAVDFKRLKEGDTGPNTGGMGCYTPVPWLPENAASEVNRLVTEPLIQCLKSKGLSYTGCLYIGLMWSEKGPSVVEFNIRLGDPEAQILAVADERDWLPLIAEKCGIDIHSESKQLPYNPKHSVVGITIASSGYPYERSDEHFELPFSLFEEDENGLIFAASVKSNESRIEVGSGRVLTTVARGKNFTEAREIVYQKVEKVSEVWPTCQWRKDIAKRVATEEGIR